MHNYTMIKHVACYDNMHTMAHVTYSRPEAAGAILGPYHPIGILYWCHYSSWDLGSAKFHQKSKRVNINLILILDTLGMIDIDCICRLR